MPLALFIECSTTVNCLTIDKYWLNEIKLSNERARKMHIMSLFIQIVSEKPRCEKLKAFEGKLRGNLLK